MKRDTDVSAPGRVALEASGDRFKLSASLHRGDNTVGASGTFIAQTYYEMTEAVTAPPSRGFSVAPALPQRQRSSPATGGPPENRLRLDRAPSLVRQCARLRLLYRNSLRRPPRIDRQSLYSAGEARRTVANGTKWR